MDIEGYSGLAKETQKIDYVEEAHKLDRSGIIVCSGEKYSMGQVLNTNERIHQMFGYTNKELIGQNINTLMPEFFKYEHTKWMRDYFKRGGKESIFDNGARTVWARDKKGYLVECNLDVRVVPDLVNGIRMIGVIH